MPPGPRKGVQSVEDGSEDEESQCCPICLNVPRPSECALPDSCNHVYCLNCLLQWAQLLQICPVDRRPFSSVYKRDSLLGYIKIPVKTSSILSTCISTSKNDKTVEGVSIEEKTQMGGKEKKRVSVQHKCKTCDVESSPWKRKMVEWETCRSQLLTRNSQHGLSGQQGETLGMMTQVITETELMTEEEVTEDWRLCRRNMMYCHSLPVPIPTPNICMPRQCPRGHVLVQKPILSTSPCLPNSGFPVQFGKVCAVTCPKGGGRKGTRGSGLKGSSTKAENVATTRSTRSRKGKSVNEETVSSSRSQQSGPSSSSAAGSDSNDVPASTSKQRLTGKRKPTAKRKGRTKKTAAQQSVVESQEEDDKEEQENGQNSPEEPDADGKKQEDEQICQEESDASDNEQDGPKSQEESDADGNEQDGPKSQEESDAEFELQEDCEKSPLELDADVNEDQKKSQEESDVDVNEQDDQKSQEESDVDDNEQDDLKIQEESDIDVKDGDSQESDEPSDADLNEQSRQSCADESDDNENELDRQKSQREADADMEDVQKQQERPNSDVEEESESSQEEAGDKNQEDSLEESDTNMEELGTDEEQQANQSPYQRDAGVNDSVDHDIEDEKMHDEDLQVEDTENADKQKDNQMLPVDDSNEEKEPLVALDKKSQLSSPSAVMSMAEESSNSSSSVTGKPQDSLLTAMEGSSQDATDPKPEVETVCKNETDGVHTHTVFGSPSAKCTAEDRSQIEQDPLATSEAKQEESQDNTESIPMDCDSPEPENTSPAGDIAIPAPQTLPVDQTPSKGEEEKNEVQEHKSETKSEDQKGSEKTDKRPRKSRFHSPTTTWSPKSESRREGSRRSRSRDRSRNTSSPHRSRGREHEDDRGSSRRNRSRERYSRRRSRSRSRNRSRSRSRSRNRTNHRGSSSERSDSRAHSPRKRDSWGGDNWRGSSRNSNWRSNSDRPSQFSGRESNSSSNGSHQPSEKSPDRSQSENAHYGKDRSWLNNDSRDREKHQETFDSPSDSWHRGGRGRGFDQGHASGHGRGGQRFSGQYGESADNWRQQRNSFSGMANNTGGDSYSNFNENRPGGKRKELESSEPPLDRSGWSAASSWAVRRTLPADVQNYYSRRGRGPGPGGSIWNKQDEEQPAAGVSKQADPPQSEPNTHIPNEAVPAPPTVLPHQLNMIGVLRYPLGPVGPQGPPLAIHPPPFTMSTQIPIHLPHAGPPPMPPMTMQGLPPPPPPPPPIQQGSFTLLPPETVPQVVTSVSVPGKGLVKASPNKTAPLQAPSSFNTASIAQPSSTTQPNSHSKAHADSSKKEKIQEKAVAEVKAAIKPYYQNKDITKDEYKEIVRKAVEKVCHSKSGEVNASKVANLVKAYVDKYKHARKNKTDKK
ncbi:protein SCAF11 isoform X2 [Trichomycterus rosablanca]|uniref:protein SCAF11 isoform X2 n=1 Tax=Trichomycterus rosablanca TaxID=2290929 RepID=UPI002F353C37